MSRARTAWRPRTFPSHRHQSDQHVRHQPRLVRRSICLPAMPGSVYPNGHQPRPRCSPRACGWEPRSTATTRGLVAEYSQEFGPGAMVGGTFDDPTKPEYIVYKVVRFTGTRRHGARRARAQCAGVRGRAGPPLVERVHVGRGPHGAPWRTYRLPDTSTPAPDDSVDVPGPDVVGDMMLWCVYNDAESDQPHQRCGELDPAGDRDPADHLRVQPPGGARPDAVHQVQAASTRAATPSTDMYISQWSDPDLGVRPGSPTTWSAAIRFRTTPASRVAGLRLQLDQQRSAATAATHRRWATTSSTARSFAIAPRRRHPAGWSSFNKYINGTDPASSDETYNYMQGLTIDGDPTVDPFGNTTSFTVAGDPVSPGPGHWLDTSPADRRMMLSSGPFTMAPGDSQEITVAIVIGQGSNRLSSISALRFNDEFAQDAFDKNFDLPSPPPQPQVDVTVDDSEVTLIVGRGVARELRRARLHVRRLQRLPGLDGCRTVDADRDLRRDQQHPRSSTIRCSTPRPGS